MGSKGSCSTPSGSTARTSRTNRVTESRFAHPAAGNAAQKPGKPVGPRLTNTAPGSVKSGSMLPGLVVDGFPRAKRIREGGLSLPRNRRRVRRIPVVASGGYAGR